MTLRQCERGAIVVFGIFGTFFLAGLVYATIGIADAALEHAHGSDRADAAALGAAVVLSRGMNLLAYINLLMASLIAVLVGLRLAETLLIFGSVTLYALAWPTYGATVPFAAVATDYSQTVHDIYEDAKDVIYPILEGLHEVEDAVRTVVPPLAIADAELAGTSGDERPVHALAIPDSLSLPVEFDEFSQLCAHGAKLGTELALLPVSAIGAGGFLEPVFGAASSMGALLSDYLCGDGSGNPPQQSEEIRRNYPRSESLRLCEEKDDAAACADAETELSLARYNETTGDCLPSSDCRRGGAFERAMSLARQQCGPGGGRNPTLWRYQRQRVSLRLRATRTKVGLAWSVLEERTLDSQFEESPKPPCGVHGTYGSLYQTRLRAAPSDELLPVCRQGDSLENPQGALPPAKIEGAELVREQLVVSELLGCEATEKKVFELAEKGEHLESDDEKSPVRIKQGVNLGDETFQVRVLATMENDEPISTRRVLSLLRSSGREENGVLRAAQALPSLFTSQSEYYFDHDGSVPAEEWLWQPRWSARLVRFRLPSNEEQEKSPREKEPGSPWNSATTSSEHLSSLEEFLIH